MRPRGGPSAELPPDAFVAFIQNHDQSAIARLVNGSTLDASEGHPGARKRLSTCAADTDAVHGRGMGRDAAIFLFLRFQRGAGAGREKRRREEF